VDFTTTIVLFEERNNMTLDPSFVEELHSAVEDIAPEMAEAKESVEAVPAAPAESISEPENETVASESSDATVEVPKVIETVGTVSDYAIERAVRAGLTFAEARAFSTESALLSMVGKFEAAHEKTQEKAVVVSDDDPLASIQKLDPDVYEPEVVKMYENLVEIIRKQDEAIKAVRSNQEQAVRATQESIANDVEKWFDDRVSKLGDDFTESLGSGAYRSLKQGSAQLQKRDALADQVAVLNAGYKASGRQPPSRDELFDAAAQLVLRGDYQKAHEKRLSSELASRAKQHINRVGGQKGKVVSDPADDIASILDAKYCKK
jgi:hypothetical protein